MEGVCVSGGTKLLIDGLFFKLQNAKGETVKLIEMNQVTLSATGQLFYYTETSKTGCLDEVQFDFKESD